MNTLGLYERSALKLSSRRQRTSVSPKNDVISVGLAPAFEEGKEQMARFNVDVAGVCAALRG
jgi:hypothetical protein